VFFEGRKKRKRSAILKSIKRCWRKRRKGEKSFRWAEYHAFPWPVKGEGMRAKTLSRILRISEGEGRRSLKLIFDFSSSWKWRKGEWATADPQRITGEKKKERGGEGDTSLSFKFLEREKPMHGKEKKER